MFEFLNIVFGLVIGLACIAIGVLLLHIDAIIIFFHIFKGKVPPEPLYVQFASCILDD